MRWLFRSPARLRAWALRHIKREPGPVTIGRRRIFILPTRLGMLYTGLLLVMLLGAMNYSNSLAFALTFLLSGLGLVCMHHTHRNLVNLRVSAKRAEPVYAGTRAAFPVTVLNPSRIPRFAVAVARHAASDGVDIAPGGDAELIVSALARRRGRMPAPRFAIDTAFPLGLFHAWAWVELEIFCLVYPKPDDSTAAPLPDNGPGAAAAQRPGDEDFHSLRAYRRGDPVRRIHWKTAARSGEPMVKQFGVPKGDALWLAWDQLPTLATEARLSRLCRWVLQAEHWGQTYGLRLPGTIVEPGSGNAHKLRCLEALALYPNDIGAP